MQRAEVADRDVECAAGTVSERPAERHVVGKRGVQRRTRGRQEDVAPGGDAPLDVEWAKAVDRHVAWAAHERSDRRAAVRIEHDVARRRVPQRVDRRRHGAERIQVDGDAVGGTRVERRRRDGERRRRRTDRTARAERHARVAVNGGDTGAGRREDFRGRQARKAGSGDVSGRRNGSDSRGRYPHEVQVAGVDECEAAAGGGAEEGLDGVAHVELDGRAGGEKDIRRRWRRSGHCSARDDLDQSATGTGGSGAVESPECIDRSPERNIAGSGYQDFTAGAAETDRAAGGRGTAVSANCRYGAYGSGAAKGDDTAAAATATRACCAPVAAGAAVGEDGADDC